MPTYTTYYNLSKPLVNSAVDQDLWGNELNSDMDTIDTTLHSLQTQITALQTTLQLPIGSYYMNETDSTNPATLLGYGTWTAVTDKFIVAHGSTYTSTGGSATAALAAANIPTISSTWNWGDGASGVTGTNTYASASNSGVTATIKGGTAIAIGAIVSNNTSGSSTGAAFSIIPPYQAAYIWKRTA